MQLLLVHGLGRTPLSLFGLAVALRRAGHHTRFFGYSPTFESVPRILRRLRNVLQRFAGLGRPVGLVGHSLGGLLLRLALPTVPELRVHHLVMLGTPAVPPRAALWAWRWVLPFRLLTRDCGRLLTSPDVFGTLSPPRVPFTVIAGTGGPFMSEPNDGVVAVRETLIPGAKPVLVPALLTVLMDSAPVRARILAIMTGAAPMHPL